MQRFYQAGDPASWVVSLPLGLLDAFIDMLPRLEAEEAIDGASRAAAAWGGEGGKRLLEQWQRQAAGDADRPAAKAVSPADAARMGIGYYVAPRAAAPAVPGAHGSAEDGVTGDGG